MLSNLYYHSESARQKLKIGVLLESSKMLRLFAEVLRDIARCDFAQLDCVIYNTPPTPPDVRAGLLWTQYLKYDQKLAAVSDDPLALEDGKSLIENVDSLSLDPSPDDAIRAVRAKDLDVILHFGFHSLGGEILHAARYGVWAFQHGDNDSYRGGPACF